MKRGIHSAIEIIRKMLSWLEEINPGWMQTRLGDVFKVIVTIIIAIAVIVVLVTVVVVVTLGVIRGMLELYMVII